MICLKSFAVFLLAGFLAPSLSWCAEPHLPSLVSVPSRYDFGRVYGGAVLRHEFTLTNQGERVVNIVRVRAACGCTKTMLTTNAVAPGGTAVLSVELDVRSRHGRQSKAIYCETDDPGNRVIRIELNVEVAAAVDKEAAAVTNATPEVGALMKVLPLPGGQQVPGKP